MLPYNRIAINRVYGCGATAVGLTLSINPASVVLLRAVTQNRQMARAVGIRSGRIDMLAFGLGSGAWLV